MSKASSSVIAEDQLAIQGGKAVVAPLMPYNSIGNRELERVIDVVRSGCLSGFYGSWCDEFFGGPQVRAFEQAWCQRFGVRHAVSVNSNTSGLIAAMGAIGIGPGDEVIVPPATMSATAMAPLVYGGIPVFADIEPDTFSLDPAAVRAAITPRTRAILVVNLFGHAAHLAELRDLAEQHGVYLVEDNAQAPLATEYERYAGTVGHIGVFSLNYHKHIHTGEGGMCVTDDDGLAFRLQMIRNHAENIVEPKGVTDLTNLFGFNFRLTEMSAAVGLSQLERIEEHVDVRQKLAESLSDAVRDLPGLTAPAVRPQCRHVYYVWALRYDAATVGVPREVFCEALNSEGFPSWTGYVRPLYMLPLFQRRVAMGRDGFPFSLGKVCYAKGLCPTAERLHEQEFLCFEPCRYAIDEEMIQQLRHALRKVYSHRHSLTVRVQEQAA